MTLIERLREAATLADADFDHILSQFATEAADELERLAAENAGLKRELQDATEAIDDPAVNNIRTLPEAIAKLREKLEQARDNLEIERNSSETLAADWALERIKVRHIEADRRRFEEMAGANHAAWKRAESERDALKKDAEMKLPCGVKLDQGTHIGKGCSVSTLMLALKNRARYEADAAMKESK